MKREIIIIILVIAVSLLLWCFLGNRIYEGLQDNSPSTPAVSSSSVSTSTQNNELILNDIQNLQQLEQQMFNTLETNTSLTTTEKEKIIEKINNLSNFRVQLYETLGGVNGFFNDALSSSLGTLKEQSAAIGIVESELNRAKKRLEILEQERNNKVRLVEINQYFGDKYEEHAQLMKIIIFMLIPIIIITVLKNKDMLPSMVYMFLLIVISIIGGVYLWQRYASIIMRDNMNYQEYNWYFDPALAPNGGSSSSADPWLSSSTSAYGTCIGQACCSPGQVYDSTSNQCVSTMTATSSSTPTTTESFETINNVLTKQQPGKYKMDYDLKANISAPLSNSLINQTKIN
jgi:hypothetical protein